jgi:hypothetical protein
MNILRDSGENHEHEATHRFIFRDIADRPAYIFFTAKRFVSGLHSDFQPTMV